MSFPHTAVIPVQSKQLNLDTAEVGFYNQLPASCLLDLLGSLIRKIKIHAYVSSTSDEAWHELEF